MWYEKCCEIGETKKKRYWYYYINWMNKERLVQIVPERDLRNDTFQVDDLRDGKKVGNPSSKKNLKNKTKQIGNEQISRSHKKRRSSIKKSAIVI